MSTQNKGLAGLGARLPTGPTGYGGETGDGGPIGDGGASEALEKARAYDAALNNSGNRHPYPWPALNPKAVRKIEVKIRVNAYEQSVLAYVAGVTNTSISKLLLKHGLAGALAEVRRRERLAGKRSSGAAEQRSGEGEP